MKLKQYRINKWTAPIILYLETSFYPGMEAE